MTHELKKGKEEVPIVRSPQEVSERIKELDVLIEHHSVYGHYDSVVGRTLSPENRRKVDIFKAKKRELQWLQGEDVVIQE